LYSQQKNVNIVFLFKFNI